MGLTRLGQAGSQEEYEDTYDLGEAPAYSVAVESTGNSDTDSILPPKYETKRQLKARHIQLIGIGGTIGTVLFVQLGQTLIKGGPGSLFIAFTIWCFPILCITNSCAELVTYMPYPSPFIRMAGRCVDEAFEVMAGWNFFFLQATLIPFEVTAVNVILNFWVDDYSPAIPFSVQLVMYVLLNVFAVKYYGESEFWLSIGKVVLALGLILFTFVTMVGGNPQHHAYGFQYWKNPGSFGSYIFEGDLGRFVGFSVCLIQACYTIAGPEYVSMAAGEAINPRKVMPRAYRAVFLRLTFFFIGGTFCIGTVVAYNDPRLKEAIKNGAPGVAASPYVLAMTNMGIPVLPHIVNALILTASFSAGNSYMYCASRTLHGMALDGHAPRFFAKTTKNGIPLYAMVFATLFGLLAYLRLGNTANTVLTWIVNLATASQLINFCVICFTYIRFYYAIKAQGMSRDMLPYKGRFQPYCGYIGLICPFIMVFLSGYPVFLSGQWSVSTFIFSYIMIPVDICIYVSWKLYRRSFKLIPLTEIDLLTGAKEMDDYTASCEDPRPTSWYGRLFYAILGI